MPSPTEAVFFAVVASLTVHELDAVNRAEWRFFFARTRIRDETAYRVFTGLHLPLFVVVLWGLPVRPFQVGLDAFVLVHAGVHLALRNHPLVDFESWFSRAAIYGTALLGGLHLLLLSWS